MQSQGRRESPKKSPRETLTRGWDGGISRGAGTRQALKLPLGGGGVRCPLTSQCAKTSSLGRGEQDIQELTWSGCGRAGALFRLTAQLGQLRLRPARSVAENQALCSPLGAAAGTRRSVAGRGLL